MRSLPIGQIVIMIASMAALAFNDVINRKACREGDTAGSCAGKITWRKFFNGWNIFLFAVLTVVLLTKSVVVFVAASAAFFGVCISKFGRGDTRYVALKTVVCFVIPLILLIVGAYTHSEPVKAILEIIAFGILLATYPLNSWAEPFFMRSPAFATNIWLIFCRPLIVSFAIPRVSNWGTFDSRPRMLICAFEMLSLFFVPILFFAKVNIKRIVGAIVCWQSGYVFALAKYLQQEQFGVITLMTVTQGILVAIVFQTADILHRKTGGDKIENVIGLFKNDYFQAVSVMSALGFLIAIPVAFMFRKGMPTFPIQHVITVLASMALPAMFVFKTYCDMSKNGINADNA